MNSKLKTLKLKLSELKHRFCYKYNYDKMAIAMEKYKNCPIEEKKDLFQIKKEIKMLKNYWKCYPTHYFRYELYKKEKSLSDEELKNYIPEFFFYSIFLPQFEDKKYTFLIEEKNITDLYFKGIDIKTPKLLGRIIKNQIFTSIMKKVNIQEFTKSVNALKIERIFFKPVNGQGGYEIDIFNRIENEVYKTKQGKKLDDNYLKNLKNDYIIQKNLKQIEDISKIYPMSINTFRIATENRNGKVRIVCATLRIGKDGKEVDNSAQGGIVLGINIKNGEFKDFATTELCEKFYEHPNTNYIFKDKKIKEWEKIKNFTIEAAKKIPYFCYLGWDVALTEEGPVAIETNLGFGIDHYQIPLGGLREMFVINNPKKYWDEIR
ncbi:sugar-transfer associated ATP-grasp domain-containing protein [Fusobacterium ulcerans]|uniref:sugar-transfer associated ATP-grasp domain-containing protein n=1 Tax=Fusobacterium ulcerans TaxID=861 RepID=UPI00241FC337|nr:sugar-transfer associated ATP-grasp domain-containing protein [Fusobacterium ulcerans]